MRNILTLANPKAAKGAARNYLTAVLHLAPFNLSGVNVCPMAELAGCIKACLNTAGRGGIAKGGILTFDEVRLGARSNRVQEARIRRTREFLTDRDAFMARLVRDIHKLAVKARHEGLTLCVRLNGTSDIRWEDIEVPAVTFRNGGVLISSKPRANIFERFPSVQFYDYTKIPNRRRAANIPNYHLTFSYSHRPEFRPMVEKARETYGERVSFSAVFSGKNFPGQFLGRPVVNGDDTDLRFLDAPGVVVALYAKGRAKKDTSGFVVPVCMTSVRD